MPSFDISKLFVNLINGKSGVVELDASDVHALPDDTLIPEPSDATPQDNGTASPGTSDEYSRADHVHRASGTSAVVATITIPAAWTDSGNGYYTSAPTISGVTLSAESKIDLQITAAQFLALQADGVENLYVENDNAALTAYAVGAAPSAAITLQCTVTGTNAPTPPVNPSLNMIYPIGSIYINVNNVNPGNLIGGTWERIQDTFLLAAGTTYAGGSTGGEAEHTLLTTEIPAHAHRITARQQWYSADSVVSSSSGSIFSWKSGTGGTTSASYKSNNDDVTSTGGDQPHNNMPPYLAVYVWKRTA